MRLGNRFILQATQKHQKINKVHLIQFSYLTGIFKQACLKILQYLLSKGCCWAGCSNSPFLWMLKNSILSSRRYSLSSPCTLSLFSPQWRDALSLLCLCPFLTHRVAMRTVLNSHSEVAWLGGETGPGLLGNLKQQLLHNSGLGPFQDGW